MQLNAEGYLPAGLHPVTTGEIKAGLVDSFPTSSARANVFEGYMRHTTDLRKVPMMFDEFIGGSFVSSKDNPGDIDLLGMGDQATIDALPPDRQQEITRLFQGHLSKPEYKCDAYFLASFPETDPAFQAYRANRKYWMGEFGFDRQDKPKGILTIVVSPDRPAPTATTP